MYHAEPFQFSPYARSIKNETTVALAEFIVLGRNKCIIEATKQF